ncbi:hypothetical protein GS399_16220 [Pedobacter sp. HMF7647]|uniref:TolB protein n=1 Tax=Hufsiella arboris TaxID=2695275 RepID=A0A7K1YD58_9SPHI|nr:hypothetical protein [Hufsiella arboris]MXV52522.1 hypothetical protein [Hufsiella arboris]
MANTLNVVINKVSLSYHITPKKITIILQNQGTSANGFVQLAPRRSEFFTTPSQDFDYQDWLNSLAVHEMRHVAQFDKLTGYLGKPFFEELALAIFGIVLPPWFYEGDAVGIETSLTNAGRGRMPEWDVSFRTNTLSTENFSYSKDYFGSVKNITPGYYQLGYYMVTKLRRDHGPNMIDSLMKRMAKLPVRPYNLSNSIKKITSLTTAKLHDSTVDELRSKWRDQLENVKPLAYPILPVKKANGPVNYLMPAASSAGKIIALKNGKTSVPKLVEIDSTGVEKTIRKIGIQEDPYFNYGAGKITWDEYRYDKRFQKRSFNVINILDLKSREYRQLTHHSRYFAPALSPDGKKIISVNVSYENKITLNELDSRDGRVLNSFPTPSNLMMQYPQYNADGTKVIVTAVGQQGTALYELNCNTKSFDQLIPFKSQLISHPIYADNNIIFKAHFNGIDNLYLLNRSTEKIQQLTSVKFGAYNPSYDRSRKRILFNNYNFNGYEISYLDPEAIKPVSLDNITDASVNYIEPVVRQEGNQDVFDSIPRATYSTKPYREIPHLFYFHSLYPVVEKNDFYDDYNLGLKIQSDNKLNTLNFYTGYQFNRALRKSEYFAGFTYSRFYPIINIQYINQARLIYQRQGNGAPSIPVSWRENQWEAKVTFPFIFNQHNYVYSSGFEVGTSYTTRYDVENRPKSFIDILNFPMEYRAYFSRNSLTGPRDLAPPWGQNFAVEYNNFPFQNTLTGELLTFKSTFYFPGILPHHALTASFNYQNATGAYDGTIDIPKVSGYSNLKYSGKLINTLLTNYDFPIFYPDWEIGPLAYIKRFKGGFFSDFENVGHNNDFSPRTFGIKLGADMNLLRFYLPNVDLGGKIIFVNEKPHQNPIFEVNLNLDF